VGIGSPGKNTQPNASGSINNPTYVRRLLRFVNSAGTPFQTTSSLRSRSAAVHQRSKGVQNSFIISLENPDVKIKYKATATCLETLAFPPDYVKWHPGSALAEAGGRLAPKRKLRRTAERETHVPVFLDRGANDEKSPGGHPRSGWGVYVRYVCVARATETPHRCLDRKRWFIPFSWTSGCGWAHSVLETDSL
jgi:hypothetical protein